MNARLHRIVYCSKGCIPGGEVEVRNELDRILASARRNNSRAGVTGALLYNADCFAQVLEGPQDCVESIFETIQTDSRHHEIAVIESGAATERMFPDWAMAYAGGGSSKFNAQVTGTFDAVFAGSPAAADQLLSLLKVLLANQS